MDKVLKFLHNFLKPVVIDNYIFWLHYRFTALILLAFSILVALQRYIGDPIDCISNDAESKNLMDSFCWVHSTFSIENAWQKKVGDEVIYPGVSKYAKGEKRVYHAYYQWVSCVLFLQAILFYVPRYLWKKWEGGRVRSFILGLDSPILCDKKKEEKRLVLVNYISEIIGRYKLYAFKYYFCEILNFVNVIGQMFLVNKFLGGAFLDYGLKVIQFTDWDWSIRYDPMIRVFPRLTKCTSHRYGSSGVVQRYDAMCILPINIINEKIYLFLWFWFIILAVVTGSILVFHICVCIFPQFRLFVLRKRARFVRPDYLQAVLRRCSLNDWFLLNLLCKNIDALNYRDLIADLVQKLERKAIDKEA